MGGRHLGGLPSLTGWQACKCVCVCMYAAHTARPTGMETCLDTQVLLCVHHHTYKTYRSVRLSCVGNTFLFNELKVEVQDQVQDQVQGNAGQ